MGEPCLIGTGYWAVYDFGGGAEYFLVEHQIHDIDIVKPSLVNNIE
jgi:hypothetical protein